MKKITALILALVVVAISTSCFAHGFEFPENLLLEWKDTSNMKDVVKSVEERGIEYSVDSDDDDLIYLKELEFLGLQCSSADIFYFGGTVYFTLDFDIDQDFTWENPGHLFNSVFAEFKKRYGTETKFLNNDEEYSHIWGYNNSIIKLTISKKKSIPSVFSAVYSAGLFTRLSEYKTTSPLKPTSGNDDVIIPLDSSGTTSLQSVIDRLTSADLSENELDMISSLIETFSNK